MLIRPKNTILSQETANVLENSNELVHHMFGHCHAYSDKALIESTLSAQDLLRMKFLQEGKTTESCACQETMMLLAVLAKEYAVLKLSNTQLENKIKQAVFLIEEAL